MDVLCALSTCPGGDLSQFSWGSSGNEPSGTFDNNNTQSDRDAAMLATCNPLAVEIYELESREEVLREWEPPKVPEYKGLHGIRMATWEEEENKAVEAPQGRGLKRKKA